MATQKQINDIDTWDSQKGTLNDTQWDEDVKKESFDVKFDRQLTAMKASLTTKEQRVVDAENAWLTYPDHFRYEIEQRLKQEGLTGQALIDRREAEVARGLRQAQWKRRKIQQSIKRITEEQRLRQEKKVSRTPLGTTYYIDADSGNDGNAGTSTGAAWATLDQFAENARSAGDVAILRRGTTAQYDDGTDCNVTSDGDPDNPIVIEADYDDAFGDDGTSAQTYTLTFGSKTATASATITGISVGQWVYNSTDSDDPREHAYEVAGVSGTTLTLRHPFKGTTGSSKTLTVMLANPQYGDGTASTQLVFSDDQHWRIQGLTLQAYDGEHILETTTTINTTVKDCRLIGNGTTNTRGWYVTARAGQLFFKKCYFYDLKYSLYNFGSLSGVTVIDTIIDANSIAAAIGIWSHLETGNFRLEEVEFMNVASTDITGHTGSGSEVMFKGRHLVTDGTGLFMNGTDDLQSANTLLVEDYGGTVGQLRQYRPHADTNDSHQIESDTTTVRSGGSNTSVKVTPDGSIGPNGFPFSYWRLLELPFYATTDSKTYEVYVKTENTTDWTANPTADELIVEVEYYASASNTYKQIKRSTSTANFTGSTSWVALSVTVAPAQAGNLTLRVYYGKTKESGKSNVFRVDPIPVVT